MLRVAFVLRSTEVHPDCDELCHTHARSMLCFVFRPLFVRLVRFVFINVVFRFPLVVCAFCLFGVSVVLFCMFVLWPLTLPVVVGV